MVVSGTTEPVPEADVDDATGTISDNARFASLFPSGEPMSDRIRYRLVPDSMMGQRGQGTAD